MIPFLEGRVLLINKPLNWTSFDAVKKIRVLTGVSKVGHAGTLDPLATGLLIICTGKFTKKIPEFMGMEKEYTGSFYLGSVTPSYDLETSRQDFRDFSGITGEMLDAAVKMFTGTILQVPPAHSAIKKDGKPVYLSARKNIPVALEPRAVTIKYFELTRIELPVIEFRVICSTGTYIRSLANDFGKALGVGAHLSQLCRTRIGEFSLADAQTPESFQQTVAFLKSSEG